MAKAMDILRKLRITGKAEGGLQDAFDARLQKLSGVRQVSVARAVLFRTAPSRSAA
ncbi:MAG: hypothetical protein R3D63_15520 [Paracoccaceae bacterium]